MKGCKLLQKNSKIKYFLINGANRKFLLTPFLYNF
uniref:Uncharacterized protein n=1 Tax=Podoviridae sp. ct8nN1 TaxID=2827296 RepID=A0A8S5R4R1_9CAUD|nr:MAG TPA: hypothetical protein [Podoviridae sp. ct8nN1]